MTGLIFWMATILVTFLIAFFVAMALNPHDLDPLDTCDVCGAGDGGVSERRQSRNVSDG